MTETDNAKALAALRSYKQAKARAIAFWREGGQDELDEYHDACSLMEIKLADIGSDHADTLIAALELVERVRVAPVREIAQCCGHISVGNEWDDEAEELEPLLGQRVALLALPIDTTGA